MNAPTAPFNDDLDDESDDEEAMPGLLEREEVLLEAAQHVKEAQAMRKYAQEKTALAKTDDVRHKVEMLATNGTIC